MGCLVYQVLSQGRSHYPVLLALLMEEDPPLSSLPPGSLHPLLLSRETLACSQALQQQQDRGLAMHQLWRQPLGIFQKLGGALASVMDNSLRNRWKKKLK